MAYKFQRGSAILSGALLQEGNVELASGFEVVIGNASLTEAELEMIDGITAGTAAASKALVLDSSQVLTGTSMVISASALSASTGQFTNLTVAANSLTIGSTTINESEMAAIDGVTAGTVAASKAVIVDSNKDASGFRNVGAVQLTTSGRVIVDDATEATSTTDGSLQTDGGLSVAKSAVIGDDLDLLSDAALLNFGADKDVSLTHVADTGLLLNSSRQLQFGDSGTYIHQSADGVLDLVADTEIEINATTVDINGAVDASSTIVAASSITAGTSFIIGSADLNETDMEKLDGITNGTAAANKAVVVDGNKDISSLRDISGRNATLSGLTEGQVTFAGSSGLLSDSADMAYNDDGMGGGKFFQIRSKGPSGNNFASIMAKTGSIVVLNADEDALLAYLGHDGELSGSDFNSSGALTVRGNSILSGSITAPGLASATVDLTADLMIIDDGATGAIKTTSLANYATALAAGSNEGLSSTAGRLALDLNDLTAAAVSVANDSIAIIDADGSNSTKKESISDLVDAMAGAGIGASSGVLSLDIDELSALGGTGVAQGDHFVFSDGGTEKKITFSNMEDAIFGNVSGDATVAAGGALTIANDAVESGMLNDNVISGQTELAADGLAAADELLISDGGTLKKIGVDNLFLDGPGLLGEAAVTVADDYIMFLDGGATGDAKKESVADLVSAIAGAGLSATSGVLAVQGNSVALKSDGDTLAEGYNYFADISAGNVGVDLPASPSVGDVVHVKAGNITNSRLLRISAQGSHLIDGESNISLESPFAAVSMVYVVANNWRIV